MHPSERAIDDEEDRQRMERVDAEDRRRTERIDVERQRVANRPTGEDRILELREEELVVNRELKDVGEIRVRTVVEDVPGRLEMDAQAEEVEIEHVPIGQAVSERREPWEEDGVMVVPVYEEQLIVTKRLVLREHLRIRRVATTRRELFEDTLRRERVVVEDPQNTGLVQERYPTEDRQNDSETKQEGGVIDHLVQKALK